MVHFSSGCHNLLRGSLGLGRATPEHKGVIVKLKVRDAQALGLPLLYLYGDGHQISDHLVPETRKLLWGVAVPAHAEKAQGHIVFKAQLFGLLGAIFYQLVEQIVKLCLMLVKKSALRLYGRLAHIAVQVLLVGAQLGNSNGFAHKGDLGAGVKLFIFRGQAVFLLHKWHNFGGEGFQLDFNIGKHQGT